MTPEQFRACVKAIGLPITHLANVMGFNRRSLQRYAKGELTVPKHVILALERLKDKKRSGKAV